MRALPRARYAWRPWDVFFAQIEGDGQSLFCLLSISLLFCPLTPSGHGRVYFFRLFRVFSRFCRLGCLLFSISQVSWFLVPVNEERNRAQEHRARRGQGQMLGHGR